MGKILWEKFGIEIVSSSVRVRKGGQHMEIDVLAYANSDVNVLHICATSMTRCLRWKPPQILNLDFDKVSAG